jgi:competence ComEA-like helix-hairpin-helix protein
MPPSIRLTQVFLAVLLLLVLMPWALRQSPDVPTGVDISYQINVNTASSGELCALPGVGRSTAERIVAMRNHLGGFKRPEDLSKVPGLGIKTYERLSSYVTVSRISEFPLPPDQGGSQ